VKLTRIRVEKYKDVDRDKNRHTFLKLSIAVYNIHRYRSGLLSNADTVETIASAAVPL